MQQPAPDAHAPGVGANALPAAVRLVDRLQHGDPLALREPAARTMTTLDDEALKLFEQFLAWYERQSD